MKNNDIDIIIFILDIILFFIFLVLEKDNEKRIQDNIKNKENIKKKFTTEYLIGGKWTSKIKKY